MKPATPSASRVHALLCCFALAVCTLGAVPFAEIGIEDDWSYARSAQVLAQTGHIVYNGWATAMLGWQLYWGALFIKLLGFSYTALRFSTLVLALVTTYLFHRCLVRLGLKEAYAALGTLTLALSPLTLSLSFTYMTDIAGLFCITACLYACIRALDTENDNATFAWLALATVFGLAGGTVRQIAWVAALVMVPSTAWLLRQRRGMRLYGALLFAFSLLSVVMVLFWFHHQPYSVPEKLFGAAPSGPRTLPRFLRGSLRAFLGAPLFLLPVITLFLAVFPWNNRRALRAAILVGIWLTVMEIVRFERHPLYVWLTPWTQNFVTHRGLIDVNSLVGDRPAILSNRVRVVLTAWTFAAGFAFFECLAILIRKHRSHQPLAQDSPSWNSLTVLLAPFSVAYLLFLGPRTAAGGMLDRYLLPIVMVCIIVLARMLQEFSPLARSTRILAFGFALTVPYAIFGVAGLHDAFAVSRGRLAAIGEMRSAGVPRTEIGGGFEYDSWTELDLTGYVNEQRIQTPAGAYHAPRVERRFLRCHNADIDLAPHVLPRYVLSFDPKACAGPSPFAPIATSQWLTREPVMIYILNAPDAPRTMPLPTATASSSACNDASPRKCPQAP